MNNIIKILLFQFLPTYSKQQLQKIRKILLHKSSNDIPIVEDIDYFKSEKPKSRRALISLLPTAWLNAENEYPNIKHFNVTGLTYEMVKVLNENGYLVDISDYRISYIPVQNYDIFIGHGTNCKSIVDNLSDHTKILQYVATMEYNTFISESNQRYKDLARRKGINFSGSIKRKIMDESFIISKADVLFSCNCPRMIQSYGSNAKKFFITSYSAYIDKALYIPFTDKNYETGKKNFIYVGGTGGNIQKGLDVLIEAFIITPDLNLYIYCLVEDEILEYYKNELNSSNIHYIYYLKAKPLQKKLKSLMRKINFTVHAPINTGLGTAFMGSLGLGLVPVGYIDFEPSVDFGVISESWDIQTLTEKIKEASNLNTEDIKERSLKALKYYNKNYRPNVFHKNFTTLIQRIDHNNQQSID